MVFNHFFYCPELSQGVLTLSVEESEHCCRALRHRTGDEILVTDGKGWVGTGRIMVDNPKACMLEIVELHEAKDKGGFRLHLAIAPTKNIDRMEWLVEKMVEIGVESISFILCDNSERQRVNMERMQRIAISALKQCQTSWLPPMEIVRFKDFLQNNKIENAMKYIAWCDENNTRQLAEESFSFADIILLIGPEGDFSPSEVEWARQSGFQDIKLGNRRLRTETAGLYGCLFVATQGLHKVI